MYACIAKKSRHGTRVGFGYNIKIHYPATYSAPTPLFLSIIIQNQVKNEKCSLG